MSSQEKRMEEEDAFGFIHIPVGEFLMGSNDLSEDESPQHEVTLLDYWMARYPVTVAQFRGFCEQSAYKAFDARALSSPDQHPVAWVNWHDALSYCEWLNDKLTALARENQREDWFWQGLAESKLRVCLPSEAEWEKAARGVDGRVYPWGNEFDPHKANIDETGIGTTSVVGCFPLGASPYGVLDMAGNVWEWTRSRMGRWDEKSEEVVGKFTYPYVPYDGREDLAGTEGVLRVIRGGSFAHDRVDTPCAYRGYDSPDTRCNYLGFRVAVTTT